MHAKPRKGGLLAELKAQCQAFCNALQQLILLTFLAETLRDTLLDRAVAKVRGLWDPSCLHAAAS